MDNKNDEFIRVDDVFKSLKYGEEPYKSGSWQGMKELLDKEMPVGKSVSGRSSLVRYALPLLALLLIGGGFYFWNTSSVKNTTPDSAQPVVQTKEQPTHSQITASNPNPQQNNAEALLNSKNQSKSNSVQAPNHSTEKIVANNHYTKQTAIRHKITNNGNKAINNPKQPGNIYAISANTSHKAPASKSKEQTNLNSFAAQSAKTVASHEIPVKEKNVKNESANFDLQTLTQKALASKSLKDTRPAFSQINIPANIIALQQSLPTLKKETIINRIKPAVPLTVSKATTQTMKAAIIRKHNLHKVAVNDKQQEIYQDKNGGLYKERTDTFTRMEFTTNTSLVARKDKNTKPDLDTSAIYKVAQVSFVPLNYIEVKTLTATVLPQKIELLPSGFGKSHLAGLPAGKGNNNLTSLVPLSKYKVSSYKLKKNTLNNLLYSVNGLSGMFDGNKKWYLGLMVGGSYGLGKPNAYGMQAGIAFMYSLAERWTLSLGARYKNNYYPNFRFWDQKVNYNVQETPLSPGTKYSGTQYTTQNTFQLKNQSAISLPVLLSYNLGRVSLFGGPTLSYYFPMKAEKSVDVEQAGVSQIVYNHQNPFIDKDFQLDPATDFKGRFGIGYSAGVRYDFSRKFSIDLRMNQMLWDNSGAYKLNVIRNMYHQPRLELNLNFFIGRREKVIYIMEKSR